MSDPVGVSQKSSQGAWNKGKLIGAKPPLSPRHVWSIRTRMQLEGRIRDNHRIVLGGPRHYADPSNTRRLLRRASVAALSQHLREPSGILAASFDPSSKA